MRSRTSTASSDRDIGLPDMLSGSFLILQKILKKPLDRETVICYLYEEG